MTKIVFVDQSGSVRDVDATEGETLMEAAVAAEVEGILAECGGGCACGTCHVYVDEGQLELVGDADFMERAMLDLAEDPRPNSRLCCQITVEGGMEGLRLTVATSP